jgi:phosphatidylethanolamine/phosphatidyl-N-methylethanolamine N-methyltransferase
MAKPVTAETVQKAYRRYARYYDLVFGAIFHPGRNTAIEHLHCQSGDRVLEVGVGTGLSLSLYPTEVQVVGIDLSEDMLKRARRKVEEESLKHVEALIQMDAQKMTFEDDAFDKVVAMYVASVVPDPLQLVTEIRRVCKPGGTIVFLNHFQNKHPVIRRAEAMIQPLAKYLGFHPDFPMSEFLEKTQFKVATAVPVNLLDYWTVLVGVNDK